MRGINTTYSFVHSLHRNLTTIYKSEREKRTDNSPMAYGYSLKTYLPHRQRSCGKVMFSQPYVILSTGVGGIWYHWSQVPSWSMSHVLSGEVRYLPPHVPSRWIGYPGGRALWVGYTRARLSSGEGMGYGIQRGRVSRG